MSRKLVSAILGVLLFSTFAAAQTTVPLNTGYNHAFFTPYTPVTTPISTTTDQYWINIASYPNTTSAVAPAFVLQTPSVWLLALPSSSWISARNEANSVSGVNSNNPGYTIFRKCFCLLPNYTAPQISFTARADDTLQMWINTQTNVLLSPQFGSFSGSALSSLPSNPSWFHAGLNCIYALVEDQYGGQMGFDLAGTVQANGLAPQAVAGTGPLTCSCNGTTQTPSDSIVVAERDDRAVVAALVQIAETRRAGRIPRLPSH